jgi:preprotein translocase subunit SecE
MVRPTAYLREVWQEIQKVTWPNRQQTIEKTLLVVGVSVIAALYIGALDAGFQWLITLLLNN